MDQPAADQENAPEAPFTPVIPAGEGQENDELEKVDVEMLWTDFTLSLEELRHTPFAQLKKKFWYRMDTLKVVLLGCDTVLQDTALVDRIGAVRIRMENLRPTIRRKPRSPLENPPSPPLRLSHVA